MYDVIYSTKNKNILEEKEVLKKISKQPYFFNATNSHNEIILIINFYKNDQNQVPNKNLNAILSLCMHIVLTLLKLCHY